jgi:arsenate reductase (glutaredoxin)
MAWKFYGYDKCSTCRKAARFLENKGVKFDSIDITQHPPTTAELEAAAARLGTKKLFNTSGQVYREMKLGEKLASLSEARRISLLAGNGRLVKRPFLVGPKAIYVGFREDEWKAIER